MHAGAEHLEGAFLNARRGGSTESAAALLPNLRPEVVSLLDSSLVHDPDQRPTAHELHSHVLKTMGTAPSDQGIAGGADDHRSLAELRGENARLRERLRLLAAAADHQGIAENPPEVQSQGHP